MKRKNHNTIKSVNGTHKANKNHINRIKFVMIVMNVIIIVITLGMILGGGEIGVAITCGFVIYIAFKYATRLDLPFHERWMKGFIAIMVYLIPFFIIAFLTNFIPWLEKVYFFKVKFPN